MLVTPAGRAKLAGLADQFATLVVSQAPYSYLSLGFLAASLLVCLWKMRERVTERPVVYLVRREFPIELNRQISKPRPRTRKPA